VIVGDFGRHYYEEEKLGTMLWEFGERLRDMVSPVPWGIPGVAQGTGLLTWLDKTDVTV